MFVMNLSQICRFITTAFDLILGFEISLLLGLHQIHTPKLVATMIEYRPHTSREKNHG